MATDLDARGAKAVIPSRRHRKVAIDDDREMNKWRHLIEHFFCKLKAFKRNALRSDKTDASFRAMISLSAAIVNSR